MISLETLEHAALEPLVGEAFVVSVVGGTKSVDLTLVEVKRLGHRRAEATRDPFSLTFRGAPGLRLPQGIYRFENATLGAMEIFVTQVGDKATGAEFEAVFT